MSTKEILELIFIGLSGIGTIGATIVALYFGFRENKIRYKIKASIVFIVNTITRERIASGYGIEIVNLSFNKNIMLNQSISVKLTKKENINLFVNKNLPKEYITPKVLMPGDSFTFLIEKKQIESILDKVNSKIITIYFSDKSNMKYKIKVKRKNLENFLNPSKGGEKINKCIGNYMLDYFKDNSFTIKCIILGISIIIVAVIMFDIIKDNAIISGLLVFIISQFILEMIIRPRVKFKEISGKIINCEKMLETGLKKITKIKNENMQKNSKISEEDRIKKDMEKSSIEVAKRLGTHQKEDETEECINNNFSNIDFRELSNDIRSIAFELYGLLESYPRICNKKKYEEVVNILIEWSNYNIFLYPCINYDKILEDFRKIRNMLT